MEIIYNLNNYRVNYNTLYHIAENLWECFPHILYVSDTMFCYICSLKKSTANRIHCTTNGSY